VVIRADDRERPRGGRHPIHAIERVLEHRAAAEQAAVLLRQALAEPALDILGESYALAAGQRERPVQVDGIALDRRAGGGTKRTSIDHEHRRHAMRVPCRTPHSVRRTPLELNDAFVDS
jgi:hypothetical protein